MVSLFLVLDIFIDMIYIAIIGLELYFYITFDEDYIDPEIEDYIDSLTTALTPVSASSIEGE